MKSFSAEVKKWNNQQQIPYHLLNAYDGQGCTPLIRAILSRSESDVLSLIRMGANVNKLSTSAESPLLIATKNNLNRICGILILTGADLNSCDLQGASALHYAVENKNLPLTSLLLSRGAHINLQDDCGDTPLHWAVRVGSLECVKLLIQYRARLNTQNEDGETALHFATAFGEVEINDLLVDSGANVDTKDNIGLSASSSSTIDQTVQEVKKTPSSTFLSQSKSGWNFGSIRGFQTTFNTPMVSSYT